MRTDGGTKKAHRIRRASTAEYYHLLGVPKEKVMRSKLSKSMPDATRIISNQPSFKTASKDQFLVAVKYVLTHYKEITKHYDNKNLKNKQRLGRYINKQKAVNEMCKRLLSGSKKYGPDSAATPIISLNENKWKSLPPNDLPNEASKPIVIAFGAAKFGKLRGNVPAPTKVIKDALHQLAQERNKKVPTFLVNIDEYLTSQICSICKRRTLEHEKSKSGDIYPVLKCTKCDKRFNRDENAAMNIRDIFLYMATHNNERPPVFARD